jgi:hypothetical protein
VVEVGAGGIDGSVASVGDRTLLELVVLEIHGELPSLYVSKVCSILGPKKSGWIPVKYTAEVV